MTEKKTKHHNIKMTLESHGKYSGFKTIKDFWPLDFTEKACDLILNLNRSLEMQRKIINHLDDILLGECLLLPSGLTLYCLQVQNESLLYSLY